MPPRPETTSKKKTPPARRPVGPARKEAIIALGGVQPPPGYGAPPGDGSPSAYGAPSGYGMPVGEDASRVYGARSGPGAPVAGRPAERRPRRGVSSGDVALASIAAGTATLISAGALLALLAADRAATDRVPAADLAPADRDGGVAIEDGVAIEAQRENLCGLHALNAAAYAVGREGASAPPRLDERAYLEEVVQAQARRVHARMDGDPVATDAALVHQGLRWDAERQAAIPRPEAGSAYQQGTPGNLAVLLRGRLPAGLRATPVGDAEAEGNVLRSAAPLERAEAILLLRPCPAPSRQRHWTALVKDALGRWRHVDSLSRPLRPGPPIDGEAAQALAHVGEPPSTALVVVHRP